MTLGRVGGLAQTENTICKPQENNEDEAAVSDEDEGTYDALRSTFQHHDDAEEPPPQNS